MNTEYCRLISDVEERQECLVAVAYLTAVIDHDCEGNQSDRFCVSFNESHDISGYYSNLPSQIQNDVDETFMNAFGFARSDVPTAYDSVILLQGLPPHRIFSGEPDAAHLPAAWNLEKYSFELEGEEGPDVPLYRPTGWATLGDVSLDGLAFRESDGIDARVATRLSAAYYFDLGLFVSGGFEFISTFAENAGVFNFDLAIEGGYYLPLSNHFGFEFFASLNLGYLMSKDADISSFDAGVGGGIRAMIPLVDEPVKSNIPSLFIGAEYSRRLNCDFLPPDQFSVSMGVLFNYV